jgi:hypothetical protein
MNWLLYVALGFLGGLAVGSYTGDLHCKNLERRLREARN